MGCEGRDEASAMTQDTILALWNIERGLAKIEEYIMGSRDLSDRELVEHLRRAASIWFKNDDLLLLEELIRRYRHKGSQTDAEPEQTPVL